MPARMQIAERTAGDVTILDLRGRLVLDEGEIPLRDHVNDLVRRGRLRVVLNLQDVTYIDSAGVGMLVAKYLTLRRAGGDMKLLHLTSRSHHVMTITRLSTVFESFDSEDEAVRSLAAPAAGQA